MIILTESKRWPLPGSGHFDDKASMYLRWPANRHGKREQSACLIAKASVRLSGLRRLKERLFIEGSVEVTLASDVTASIGKDDFLKGAGVRDFERQLHSRIRGFLEKVDPSFAPLLKSVALVLAGGGRDLPMVFSLTSQNWTIHGTPVTFRLMPRVPAEFARYGESFSREYPQLAVAIGGARPNVLDERDAIADWAGGVGAPGPLSRFPTKGV